MENLFINNMTSRMKKQKQTDYGDMTTYSENKIEYITNEVK